MAAPPLPPSASLDQLRLHALYAHPGLEVARLELEASRQRESQARTWPFPRFSYLEYLRSVETRTGPMERSFGLSQTIPWSGRLGLAGDVEAARVRVRKQEFFAAVLAVDQRLRSVYADFYLLGRTIQITRETLALLGNLESVARSKLAAGAENHPDLLRLQLEIRRLEETLASAREERAPVLAELNALLGRPAAAPLDGPTELVEPPPVEDEARLRQEFAEYSPRLAELARRTETARRELDLARRSILPDITVGLQTIEVGRARQAGTRGSGEDPWMVSVSVEVPLWYSKWKSGVREAESRHRARRMDEIEQRQALAAELEQVLFDLRDARRKLELFRDTLIPGAREVLTSTIAAFQADRADFLDLIETERDLLRYRLSLARSRAELLRARAHLDRILGHLAPDSPLEETRS